MLVSKKTASSPARETLSMNTISVLLGLAWLDLAGVLIKQSRSYGELKSEREEDNFCNKQEMTH